MGRASTQIHTQYGTSLLLLERWLHEYAQFTVAGWCSLVDCRHVVAMQPPLPLCIEKLGLGTEWLVSGRRYYLCTSTNSLGTRASTGVGLAFGFTFPMDSV